MRTPLDEIQNLAPQELVTGIEVNHLRKMIMVAKLEEARAAAFVAAAERAEELSGSLHQVRLVALRYHQHRRNVASGNMRHDRARFVERRILSEVLANRVEARIVGIPTKSIASAHENDAREPMTFRRMESGVECIRRTWVAPASAP